MSAPHLVKHSLPRFCAKALNKLLSGLATTQSQFIDLTVSRFLCFTRVTWFCAYCTNTTKWFLITVWSRNFSNLFLFTNFMIDSNLILILHLLIKPHIIYFPCQFPTFYYIIIVLVNSVILVGSFLNPSFPLYICPLKLNLN